MIQMFAVAGVNQIINSAVRGELLGAVPLSLFHITPYPPSGRRTSVLRQPEAVTTRMGSTNQDADRQNAFRPPY